MAFEEAKQPNEELFEIGLISYLPRECILKENELIGAGNPYDNEVESDFEDIDEDVEEENERNAFNNEV